MVPFIWILFCVIIIFVWELLKIIAKFWFRPSNEIKEDVSTLEDINDSVEDDVLTLDYEINSVLHQSRHRKIGSENFPVIISDVSDASESNVSDEEVATSVSAASSETDTTIVSELQKPAPSRTSSYPFPPGVNPWGRGRPKAQFRRPKKPLRMLSPAEQVARELRVPVDVIEIIPSNSQFTVYRLKKGK
ncbi:hypothetical protein C2G38_2249376 [Gigaspora rosea]|uniref:Uncharacterized protein n=1 Tax=Gigaspora rosea TaxID=44941 RepID=A0A397UYK5_9GLOM|nr:hypothetical protein C2G38_2249376 [Gigaspora rosea]